MTAAERAAIRRAVLRFYDRHRRDLPWRRRHEPYAVWVAEIMLQQTQVETVRPRYAAFLAEFPDVATLAAASEARVCEAWAGLGYYRRARHLHRAARQVVTEHRGELPASVAALRQLPGIGRYTAGAISSIAFAQQAPIVDGNVARLFARLHARRMAGAGRTQEEVWRWAEQLVAGPRPGDLNQALMDLGATVCTPRAPRCRRCPLRRYCAAFACGAPERYPGAKRGKPRPRLEVAFLWCRGPRGVWLHQRPVDGLWAGLWEPPSASGSRARAVLSAATGTALRGPVARVRHELTHRQIEAAIYLPAARVTRGPRWRCFPDPAAAPLSALARKVIDAAMAAARPVRDKR